MQHVATHPGKKGQYAPGDLFQGFVLSEIGLFTG